MGIDPSMPKLEQFMQLMLEVFIAWSNYQAPACQFPGSLVHIGLKFPTETHTNPHYLNTVI